MDSADNYAGELIAAVNAGDLIYCANILISDDMADELITSAINSDDSKDCDDNAKGGLIATIKIGHLMDCADISTSDEEAEELIAADAGNSTECADTNALYNLIDAFMMLLG